MLARHCSYEPPPVLRAAQAIGLNRDPSGPSGEKQTARLDRGEPWDAPSWVMGFDPFHDPLHFDPLRDLDERRHRPEVNPKLLLQAVVKRRQVSFGGGRMDTHAGVCVAQQERDGLLESVDRLRRIAEQSRVDLVEGAWDFGDVIDGHRAPSSGRIGEQVEGFDDAAHADLSAGVQRVQRC